MGPLDAHLALITPGQWHQFVGSAYTDLYGWHRIDQALHGEDMPLRYADAPKKVEPCWTCRHASTLLVPR